MVEAYPAANSILDPVSYRFHTRHGIRPACGFVIGTRMRFAVFRFMTHRCLGSIGGVGCFPFPGSCSRLVVSGDRVRCAGLPLSVPWGLSCSGSRRRWGNSLSFSRRSAGLSLADSVPDSLPDPGLFSCPMRCRSCRRLAARKRGDSGTVRAAVWCFGRRVSGGEFFRHASHGVNVDTPPLAGNCRET
jgi:hypothetical protein